MCPSRRRRVINSTTITICINFWYFLFLIRPQQKRAKAHRELVMNVVKGDKITTSGGLRGKIVKSVAENDYVDVEIAKDVKVEVLRTMIATVEKKDAS